MNIEIDPVYIKDADINIRGNVIIKIVQYYTQSIPRINLWGTTSKRELVNIRSLQSD